LFFLTSINCLVLFSLNILVHKIHGFREESMINICYYLKVVMTLHYSFAINPTFIGVSPANSFPIFLLIFKEDILIIKILSHFYANVVCVIRLASNTKSLDCISNISDSIFLCLSILAFHACKFIFLIRRKQMYSTSW
jgi:hypothetical protein